MITLRNSQRGYETMIKSWNPHRNKRGGSINTNQILKEKGGKKNNKK
jgi:hypothetical protein